MATKRRYDLQGCRVTLGMMKASAYCMRAHGVPLRDYLLRWRTSHQREDWDALARELQVHRSTLYDWFEWLDLEVGGSILIDRRAERAPAAAPLVTHDPSIYAAAVAAEQAEASAAEQAAA